MKSIDFERLRSHFFFLRLLLYGSSIIENLFSINLQKFYYILDKNKKNEMNLNLR